MYGLGKKYRLEYVLQSILDYIITQLSGNEYYTEGTINLSDPKSIKFLGSSSVNEKLPNNPGVLCHYQTADEIVSRYNLDRDLGTIYLLSLMDKSDDVTQTVIHHSILVVNNRVVRDRYINKNPKLLKDSVQYDNLEFNIIMKIDVKNLLNHYKDLLPLP